MAKTMKTRKFVVRKGSSIFIGGSGVDVQKKTGGDVVTLTAKLAKHFHSHGCLDPYMEDFDDAEETKTDEEAEA